VFISKEKLQSPTVLKQKLLKTAGFDSGMCFERAHTVIEGIAPKNTIAQ
tara:strand:+ start:303 stop:449 length:147 start_codon:yes stop_codon:yes gene_type:complete